MSGLGSRVGWKWQGLLSVLALLDAGCSHHAHSKIEAIFDREYSCGSALATETEEPGVWEVTGCGQQAKYECDRDSCTLLEPSSTTGGAPPPSMDKADVRRRREHATPLSSDIRVETNKGKAVLLLDMRLDRSSFLRLSAVPEERADLLQLKVVRRDSMEASEACALEFMIDGQRRPLAKTSTSRDGYVLSQRVQVGPDVMNELAVASKVAFRACEQRWSLNRYQVQLVRDFMDRMEDERAWKGQPSSERRSGLIAPSGGWPEWKSADSPAPPVGTRTDPLEPTALFKTLSVSVFQLEATRPNGVAQGSAVAISATELLTNCHVLQEARKLVVKQGKSEWTARVSRAEPQSDRCVVAVLGANFTPIATIRAYHTIEVGETVYTLGSPVGLELTLSNGIISGRREEQGHAYLQTTAPISPGSSGGGLFDARGNLIGITTLAIVGRERLNQALNFAIPADTFWQK
jgi:S1-C subfamily serine protease